MKLTQTQISVLADEIIKQIEEKNKNVQPPASFKRIVSNLEKLQKQISKIEEEITVLKREGEVEYKKFTGRNIQKWDIVNELKNPRISPDKNSIVTKIQLQCIFNNNQSLEDFIKRIVDRY